MGSLSSKKVAILATDGFEQSEFQQPYDALIEAGATVEVVSLKAGKIKGWKDKDWGDEVDVDTTVYEADAKNYDALVLPGGVMNPDSLRKNLDAVNFVNGFFDDNKPIAAICHAPWTLIETGELQGRTLTSFPSLRTDLENAGATWLDRDVVVDNGLITSRTPADLPAFCAKMIEEIGEGVHS